MRIPFLEALQRLRGSGGFKTKNIFVQLSAAASKKPEASEALTVIGQAEATYEKRKVLFHSLWGFATGPRGAVAVGIQDWSGPDYANFRSVELVEIVQFASECESVSRQLMEHVIPLFHGASGYVVDDDDGMPHGHEV
jgi:hypothetical protein